VAEAGRGLIERESLVELIALAAVAREHLLVIGPPGTAKSEAVRRVAKAIGGEYFEYLLGRFTEPSEIFGPIDLRKLKEGVVETETSGMLPEAEVAFLDEVFLGSTAILNTLLQILNERTFRRGHSRLACPLRVCVGASNALPKDDALAAFADRFLLRVFVDAVPAPRIEQLLEGGWALQRGAGPALATLAEVDLLAEASQRADLSLVRPEIAHAVRLLRGEGIALSDRRAVKLQRLIAAAAAMAGRSTPTAADLWPIIYALPTAEDQRDGRNVLKELLLRAESTTLPAAAAEASLGPLARAARIAELGEQVLLERPPKEDAAANQAWQLRLEAIGREIDAGFSKDALPESLAALRARVVEQGGLDLDLGVSPSGKGRRDQRATDPPRGNGAQP
jgi:MoxR-like ATPase